MLIESIVSVFSADLVDRLGDCLSAVLQLESTHAEHLYTWPTHWRCIEHNAGTNNSISTYAGLLAILSRHQRIQSDLRQ